MSAAAAAAAAAVDVPAFAFGTLLTSADAALLPTFALRFHLLFALAVPCPLMPPIFALQLRLVLALPCHRMTRFNPICIFLSSFGAVPLDDTSADSSHRWCYNRETHLLCIVKVPSANLISSFELVFCCCCGGRLPLSMLFGMGAAYYSPPHPSSFYFILAPKLTPYNCAPNPLLCLPLYHTKTPSRTTVAGFRTA